MGQGILIYRSAQALVAAFNDLENIKDQRQQSRAAEALKEDPMYDVLCDVVMLGR